MSHRDPPAAATDPGRRATVILLLCLFVFAVPIVVQAALGFAGFLAISPTVIVAIALGSVCAAVASPRPRPSIDQSALPVPRETWSAADRTGAVAVVVALCNRAWAGLHRSTFLYDVLSYHLHVPAAWRAAGRIWIVPTPFGDPAAAYAPGNAELIYHLALAATGNARLAHAGQIPFAGLALVALYATSRTLGTSRAVGFATALAFLLIPEVWQQAPTAMADLALAAFFLAVIPFLLRLGRRRERRDVVGVGVALGLLIGTKYVSLVQALPLLIAAAAVLLAHRAEVTRTRAVTVVAVLVFVCGGFWYLRNALVTRNPLFPATLRLGRFTLAPGLVDGAMIRTSAYHLPVTDIKALLEILSETGWGFLVGVTLAVLIVRPWRWLALAAALLLLDWFVVPYQQSRFFFPVWGVCAIMLAQATRRKPRLGLLALLAATVGGVLQFPTSGRLLLLLVAGLCLACAPALRWPWWKEHLTSWFTRRFRLATSMAAAIVAVVAVVVTISWARAARFDPEYAVGDPHDQAWSWMREHVHHQRIAYTGSNLPLPLWGGHFENQVDYVSVAGAPHAAPHDFLDVPRSAPTRTTAEPAPEREFPDRRLWLANLRAVRTRILFVAALYPEVQHTIAHDEAAFPIERAWADQDPRRFPLLFANDGIRIYGCTPEGIP